MRIATYRTQTRIEVGVLSQDGSAITPFDIPPERAAGGLLALLGVDQTLLPLRDVDHPLNSSEVELLIIFLLRIFIVNFGKPLL